MDRPIVYPGAIPLDTDLLNTNRNVMKAVGMLAQAVLGSGTVVSGLAVAPNSPAAMNVVVGPGSIFQLSTVDATAYGSLAADTADALLKQGINIASTTLAISAPSTSGQSQNYLIEAALLEADGTPVVLPYYNAANPSAPYLGPANSGTAQNTLRAQTVQLQAKAGVPATSGTQTTPAVDAGWVALAVVTVSYGASSIGAGNIGVAPGNPAIPYTLPQLAPGFAHVASFTASGTWTVPAGVSRCRVRVWGGGGGGGGAAASSAGSGGTGGGYSEGIFSLAGIDSVSVTVGGGGAGGGTTAGTGGAGGTSSFGTLISATGGSGGNNSTSGDAAGVSTVGTGSGGTVNISGGVSAAAYGTSPLMGSGGGSAFGSSQTGPSIGPGGMGGIFPGGGGGGAGGAGAANGAGGAAGLVIIDY